MDSYIWVVIAAGTSLGILLIWIWRGRGQAQPSLSRIDEVAGVGEAPYRATKGRV